MTVPTTGSFLMFGTGSNTTIAGAIIEGGANAGTVSSTLNFNALKALANINKFDPAFKEGATTLSEIVKTTQFRGYPIVGTTTTTTTAAPTTTTTTASPTTTTTTTTAAPTTTTTTTAAPLYYTLNSCNPGDPLYDTTITPLLTNQRYVDPISGNFWTWDNAAGTSSPQQTVNSSLQIVSGQSGCS